MKICILALLFLLANCSSSPSARIGSAIKKNNGQVYAFRDVSGEFELTREVKFEKGKLATRVQIMSGSGDGERLTEKTFAMASVGSVKTKKGRSVAVRPEISQHTIWLEGKKYFTQLKLNQRRKVMEVIMESPETKWAGKREIKVPRGRIFCFYSQLPECLVASGLLAAAEEKGRRLNFMMIWDSWPYQQEEFTGLGPNAFAPAVLRAERSEKSARKFNVEVNGQALSLHFSKDSAFVRMFWTSQGISILPPSEVQDSQEIQ